MKKTIINLLLFTITVSTIFSCNKLKINKEKETTELKTTVIVDTIKGLEKIGSLLRFETVDDYVDFIEDTNQVKWTRLSQFTTNQGFQNFFTQNSNINVEDSNAMDIYLGQLLNVDGVLIIGDNALKIDLPEKKVYLTALNSLASNYQSLINGDIENKLISWFSTDDDIIDYLLYGFIEKCGGIDGGTYPCYNNNANSLLIGTIANIDVRLNPGVKFFQAGIYHRLSALYELINFNTNGVYNIEIEVKGPQGWYKKRPCNSGSTGTTPASTFINSTLSAKQKTFYVGTRNLNGYYFFIRARAKKPDGTYTEWTPYGGRNINSPY